LSGVAGPLLKLRAYDEKGLRYTDEGAYVVDTVAKGNSNTGHGYGTALAAPKSGTYSNISRLFRIVSPESGLEYCRYELHQKHRDAPSGHLPSHRRLDDVVLSRHPSYIDGDCGPGCRDLHIDRKITTSLFH
jgi:hypothetical protein